MIIIFPPSTMTRELLFQSLSDQLLAAYSDSTPFPFGSVIFLPFITMMIYMEVMVTMVWNSWAKTGDRARGVSVWDNSLRHRLQDLSRLCRWGFSLFIRCHPITSIHLIFSWICFTQTSFTLYRHPRGGYCLCGQGLCLPHGVWLDGAGDRMFKQQ